jgi:cobalamin biosynthesis protein CobD/CbiB
MLDLFKTEIINPLILLMFGAAMIVFFWGVIQFIYNAGNETKRSESKQHILWGLIGLFIMVAVYGILNLIIATINQFTH